MLAGLALALRFVPYSDHKGHLRTGWTLVMLGIGVLAVAASVYLVYVLEILKFRRLAAIRQRRLRPDASPAEIAVHVTKDLETGEFQAVAQTGHGEVQMRDDAHPPGAQQPVGERQVDQDSVGAEHERGGAQAPIAADGR